MLVDLLIQQNQWRQYYLITQIGMGCCSSDSDITDSIFESVELYLNKCQLLTASKMKKKCREIILFIYLKSKLDILGSIFKDIQNFDRLSDLKKHPRGRLDLIAYDAISVQQLITKIRADRQRFKASLQIDSIKLKNIEDNLHTLKQPSEAERPSVHIEKATGNMPGAGKLKSKISGQYRDRFSAMSKKSSTSKRSSVFELQELKQTYSFPMQVVELNKKSFELLCQDTTEKEQRIQMLEQSNRILSKRVIEESTANQKLREEYDKLMKDKTALKKTVLSQEDCINSLKKDFLQLKECKEQLRKSSDQEKAKNDFLLQRLQTLNKQLEKMKFQKGTSQSSTQIQISDDKDSRQKGLVNTPTMKGSQNITEKDETLNDSSSQLSYLFPEESKKHLRRLNQSYETILRLFVQSTILPSYKYLEEAISTRLLISELLSRQITGTKLLFAYDDITKNTFEKHIDNVSNLLLLVQLEDGIKLGGFAGQIDEGGNLRESFLFSLRNNKSIKLETKNKVNKITAERNYINFGNGELRIKARNLTLQNNISGFQCEYFLNGRGASRFEFMGSEDYKREMKAYEVFKVYFD